MNASPPLIYEFGDFQLDLEEHALLPRDGAPVSLTPRVFETLRYLVEHAGRIADKQSLMDAVWPDCVVEENNLAQNISTLRRIFGDKPGATQRYIATVPGRGYRFLPEVRIEKNGATATPAVEPARPRAEDSSSPAQAPPARGQAGSMRHLLVAVGIVILLAGAAARFWPRSVEPPLPEKGIAVLPFANLSADPSNTYFAEGVKDEILTRLARISALKVISRTSTEEFASKPHNVREIARRLGVAHILEGSVQKSGRTVRVTVQLIHAPSDTHLWAESFDRNLEDMFQVESDIAQRIASALEARLSGPEKEALSARPTANLEAYHEYLRGRFFWNKRTPEGFREAALHLRRAVELDPTYAQAHAGLADALMFMGGARGQIDPQSRVHLQKALALDDTLAEAHASLGLLAMNVDWNWAEAEREFKRAIELNPNYATAHQWYGEFLAYMGRFDEAIAESERARELDPLSLIINTDLAKVLSLARRYDEAVTQFRATLKLDPEFAEAHGLLGLTHSLQGKHEEAVAEMRQIKGLEHNPVYLAWLAYVYGSAGQTGGSPCHDRSPHRPRTENPGLTALDGGGVDWTGRTR